MRAIARKLSAQKKELASAHDREKYKRTGELITANLYQLEKSMNKAKVIDYYNKDCPEVEISLDVRLTPQQNAQKYFKLYTKSKTAEEVLTEQIRQGSIELDYLESVLVQLGEAETERDLAQLREELTLSGVLSAKQTRNKKGRQKPVQANEQRSRRYRQSRSIIGQPMVLIFSQVKTTFKTIFLPLKLRSRVISGSTRKRYTGLMSYL